MEESKTENEADSGENPNESACPPASCSLLRAWKIEPAGNTGIDTIFVVDNNWRTVMEHAEYSLEQQMESDGSGNMERPWDEMKVTITGVLLTSEEWEEISTTEY